MSLSLISGSGGSRVSLAVQIPASVFIVSKDFCASEFGAGVSTALYACVSDCATTDFCASDWAKATVESEIRTTDSIYEGISCFILLKKFTSSLFSGQGYSLASSVEIESALMNLCSSAVIVNYNTIPHVKLFLIFLAPLPSALGKDSRSPFCQQWRTLERNRSWKANNFIGSARPWRSHAAMNFCHESPSVGNSRAAMFAASCQSLRRRCRTISRNWSMPVWLKCGGRASSPT